MYEVDYLGGRSRKMASKSRALRMARLLRHRGHGSIVWHRGADGQLTLVEDSVPTPNGIRVGRYA